MSVCSTVREVAQAAGIDIAAIPALRCGDEAAAELLALGDTPEVTLADRAIIDRERKRWRAQHPGQPNAADRLEAHLLEIGRSYRAGETPGPSGSIMQWYAWALVQCETPLSAPVLAQPGV